MKQELEKIGLILGEVVGILGEREEFNKSLYRILEKQAVFQANTLDSLKYMQDQINRVEDKVDRLLLGKEDLN